MKINNIKRESLKPQLIIGFLGCFFSLISVVHSSIVANSINDDLANKSLSMIELTIDKDLSKLQEQQINNNKDKYYNKVVKMENPDQKHIIYTYNSEENFSNMLGINLLLSLGGSKYTDNINKISLNGQDISVDDIKNADKIRQYISKKIIKAEKHNDSDLETIIIELK